MVELVRQAIGALRIASAEPVAAGLAGRRHPGAAAVTAGSEARRRVRVREGDEVGLAAEGVQQRERRAIGWDRRAALAGPALPPTIQRTLPLLVIQQPRAVRVRRSVRVAGLGRIADVAGALVSGNVLVGRDDTDCCLVGMQTLEQI